MLKLEDGAAHGLITGYDKAEYPVPESRRIEEIQDWTSMFYRNLTFEISGGPLRC